MLSLRERRRLDTARDIQRATLRLAEERGLDQLTTEAIADAAGISPRTFFNYFPNKEAACFGVPPRFTDAAKQQLTEGTQSLQRDLRAFLERHLEEMAGTEDIVRNIGPVVRQSSKVRRLLDEHLHSLGDEMADCLQARLPGSSRAARCDIASWALQSLGAAIDLWSAGDTPTLSAALDVIWQNKLEAARILSESDRKG